MCVLTKSISLFSRYSATVSESKMKSLAFIGLCGLCPTSSQAVAVMVEGLFFRWFSTHRLSSTMKNGSSCGLVTVPCVRIKFHPHLSLSPLCWTTFYSFLSTGKEEEKGGNVLEKQQDKNMDEETNYQER